jgi:hypothetical protein
MRLIVCQRKTGNIMKKVDVFVLLIVSASVVVVHGGSDENYDFSDCNFFVIVCDNETSQDK